MAIKHCVRNKATIQDLMYTVIADCMFVEVFKGLIAFTFWAVIEFSYKEVSLSVLTLCAETPYIKKGVNTVSVSGVESENACIFIDYEGVTVWLVILKIQ